MDSDSKSNRSENLYLTLIENSLDFLLSAAEAVRRDDEPRRLKDAVLNAASGVELLLKARIAREHWSLVFSNIDQANYESLTKGDFISVEYKNARIRLEQILGISIAESFSLHLDQLRKLRNRLTHFTATLDSAQAKSLVAKSINFCVEFCEQEETQYEEIDNRIGEINTNLADLREFVEERMATINKEWDYAVMWSCPECWQTALVIDGGQVDCKFCKAHPDPQDLAHDNSEIYPEDCPECYAEGTFAFIIYSNEEAGWLCFSCGERGERYDHCVRCDRMTHTHDLGDIAICSDCVADIMERD